MSRAAPAATDDFTNTHRGYFWTPARHTAATAALCTPSETPHYAVHLKFRLERGKKKKNLRGDTQTLLTGFCTARRRDPAAVSQATGCVCLPSRCPHAERGESIKVMACLGYLEPGLAFGVDAGNNTRALIYLRKGFPSPKVDAVRNRTLVENDKIPI